MYCHLKNEGTAAPKPRSLFQPVGISGGACDYELQLWPGPHARTYQHCLTHFYVSLVSDAYLLTVQITVTVRIWKSQGWPSWGRHGRPLR